MFRTVVTICRALWSLYVPYSGHYTYRTVVTICTALWSVYVPHSGHYTRLYISLFGISEIDCTTTKTDTAQRSISIGRGSLQVFFSTHFVGILGGYLHTLTTPHLCRRAIWYLGPPLTPLRHCVHLNLV
jgi:hypothetical protein